MDNNDEASNESESVKLEKDIRSGERWLIGINATSIILSVAIALIYYGQLKEMRKATKASVKAANAAASAADTADKTLKEIRAGSTDTHDLAVAAGKQADAAKRQAEETSTVAKITQKTLNLGQQAYVTVGRPDGVVGEIVMPTDLETKASVVVYFQNSGHLPAQFNWGNSSPIIRVLPSDPKAIKEPYAAGEWPDFSTDHYFRPMWRAKNKKQPNGVVSTGTITIAGNSTYEGVLWEIPSERMLQMMNMDRPFMPSGKFDYCDGLGHHVCRRFDLQYSKSPHNRLFLVSEEECGAWEMQVLNPDPELEYLAPCEVSDTREELRMSMPDSPKP